MLRPLTYLAGPYSHRDPEVKQARFEHLSRAAGWLMRNKGWNVFSPISSSHPMHVFGNVPGDWAFWERVDTEYLAISQRIVICTLPGWEDSVGVTAELKIAHTMGLEVLYLIPHGPDNYLLTSNISELETA